MARVSFFGRYLSQIPPQGLAFLVLMLASYALLFIGILRWLPPPSEQAQDILARINTSLHLPTLEDARLLREAAIAYSGDSGGDGDQSTGVPIPIIALLSLAYIGMMTFAIPGSLSLSILAGALMGANRALVLVAVVSCIGACCTYTMSYTFGAALVTAIWPQRLEQFRREVEARRGRLVNYLIMARLSPVPNTFINVASPIVGVPLPTFALGTILGTLPNNFAAVSAGERIGDMTSLKDLYSTKSAIALGAAFLCSALPLVLHRSKSGGGRRREDDGDLNNGKLA